MTMNESYLEYHRQLETMRRNNIEAQNRLNKYVLVAAGVLFTFVTAVLILGYFDVIKLS